jgi:hypothetical protein
MYCQIYNKYVLIGVYRTSLIKSTDFFGTTRNWFTVGGRLLRKVGIRLPINTWPHQRRLVINHLINYSLFITTTLFSLQSVALTPPKYILNEIQLSETAFKTALMQARVAVGLYPCVVSSAENPETCYKIGSSESIKNSKDFWRFSCAFVSNWNKDVCVTVHH